MRLRFEYSNVIELRRAPCESAIRSPLLGRLGCACGSAEIVLGKLREKDAIGGLLSMRLLWVGYRTRACGRSYAVQRKMRKALLLAELVLSSLN